MPRTHYDVVVIGSGLAGLTAANILARQGRSVLLLEQHYKLGGMATWFKRPGGHIFDISLHGFPYGMVKIVPAVLVEGNRRLDRATRRRAVRQPDVLAVDVVSRARISRTSSSKNSTSAEERLMTFFDNARGMNFYDDQTDDDARAVRRVLPRPRGRDSPA